MQFVLLHVLQRMFISMILSCLVSSILLPLVLPYILLSEIKPTSGWLRKHMQSRVHVLPFPQVIFSLLEDHLHMFRSERLGSKVIEDCALRPNEQDFAKSCCFSSFVNS